MSQSQRLSLQDAQAIFRVTRELCELGDDAVAWRSHMLDRLDSLVTAVMSMAFIGDLPFEPARIAMPLFVGKRLDPHWVKYRNSRDVRPDPCTAWIVPRLGNGFTELRQRMCDDRTWYGSEYFNEILHPIRQDHYLVSVVALPERRIFSAIGLTGQLGNRPFSRRTQQIIELLHNELALLWRTPSIAPDPEWRKQLSSRLAEVLDALLEGLSEKQISMRLGLKRTTVHNHVSRLHESLGVSSRGELLAKARRRPSFRPRLAPA